MSRKQAICLLFSHAGDDEFLSALERLVHGLHDQANGLMRLSRALPRILWCWLRWVQHDALAEQGEAGAAVHLALYHLDLVDGALDPARAVREGEPVNDRFLVVADPGGERAQLRLVVGFYCGEPGIEGPCCR